MITLSTSNEQCLETTTTENIIDPALTAALHPAAKALFLCGTEAGLLGS